MWGNQMPLAATGLSSHDNYLFVFLVSIFNIFLVHTFTRCIPNIFHVCTYTRCSYMLTTVQHLDYYTSTTLPFLTSIEHSKCSLYNTILLWCVWCSEFKTNSQTYLFAIYFKHLILTSIITSDILDLLRVFGLAWSNWS